MNRRQIMTSLAGLGALAAGEIPSFALESGPTKASYLPVFDPRQMGAEELSTYLLETTCVER